MAEDSLSCQYHINDNALRESSLLEIIVSAALLPAEIYSSISIQRKEGTLLRTFVDAIYVVSVLTTTTTSNPAACRKSGYHTPTKDSSVDSNLPNPSSADRKSTRLNSSH